MTKGDKHTSKFRLLYTLRTSTLWVWITLSFKNRIILVALMKFTTPPSPSVLDNLFSKWSNHSTMQRINPIHVVHVWEKYDDSIIVVYANKELSYHIISRFGLWKSVHIFYFHIHKGSFLWRVLICVQDKCTLTTSSTKVELRVMLQLSSFFKDAGV